MKTLKVNNKRFKEVINYFKNCNDITIVYESDLPLKGIEGNIYGLYVDNILVYIGERKQGKITERLNQHLHQCPKGTSSKLSEVQNAYRNKQIVGYKTLLVNPDYERYSVETYLIMNIDSLEWNIRDRNVKHKKTIEVSNSGELEIEINNYND